MSTFTCTMCGASFKGLQKGLPRTEFYGKTIVNGAFCPLCYSSKRIREGGEKLRIQLYRAKKVGTPATLTLKQWLIILDYFDWCCAYCDDAYTQMDHFIPLSKGGGTTAYNCLPICCSCNCKKNRYEPERTGASPERIEQIRIFLEYQKFAWEVLDN